MYRISNLFYIILVIALLAACGGGDTEETAVSSTPSTAQSTGILDNDAPQPEQTSDTTLPSQNSETDENTVPSESKEPVESISTNPEMEKLEEAVDKTAEDVNDEIMDALAAGEEVDSEAISEIAEGAIEENFADMLDAEKYGDIDVEDLPLPLACDIVAQLDLEAIAGGPVAPPKEEFVLPEIVGAPNHVSMCNFYTPEELWQSEPDRIVSLTVSQPKPGAPIYSPEEALAMYKEGLVTFLDIDDEANEIEVVPGFNGLAFWSFGQLTIYREDGATLIMSAGEGFQGTPEQTLAFAEALESVLP